MVAEASPAEGNQRSGLAIALLIGGVAIFSIQDIVVRELSDLYPLTEFVFLRTVFSIFPILALVVLEGGLANLRFRRLRLHLLRGVLLFSAYGAYFVAVAAVPLAVAVALFFCSPLLVTALAAFFLKEKVGPRRWLAVLAGFIGVLMILQPGGEAFDAGALVALLSALIYAIVVVITRRLGTSESGVSMLITQTVVYFSLGGLGIILPLIAGTDAETGGSLWFLTGAWVMPEARHLGMIAMCGLIAALAFYGLTQAYIIGAPSVVAPFEYSGMGWGLLWGYLFWSEIPGPWAFAGMAVILAAGLYIIRRESVRGQKLVSGRQIRGRT